MVGRSGDAECAECGGAGWVGRPVCGRFGERRELREFGLSGLAHGQHRAVHVIIGTTSPVMTQSMANAGNVGLSVTTPFTTTDARYAVSSNPAATTCGSTLAAGAVCGIGFSFTPTVLGPVGAQSNLASNFYSSPQTIQLNGYGLFTQGLPFSLPPETEVYGHAFTQTAALSLAEIWNWCPAA